MTKVIVIGAGGSLAAYVIEALKERPRVLLTLFARNSRTLPQKLSSGCTVIEGDATRYRDIQAAVKGQDIVYINLNGELERMARNIVDAMKEAGVQRVIAISSIGIYAVPLKPVLQPYRKLADIIENAGLDYTILRPDWFTSANEIDFSITHKGQAETGGAVSRKSIAAFVASIVDKPDLFKNENLGISKPG